MSDGSLCVRVAGIEDSFKTHSTSSRCYTYLGGLQNSAYNVFLPFPKTDADNAALANVNGDQEAWIGCYNHDGNLYMHESNSQIVAPFWSNWAPGEDGLDEDKACFLTPDGKWSMATMNEKKRTLCAYRP